MTEFKATRAKLYLLRTEEGGRKNDGFGTGYHGMVCWSSQQPDPKSDTFNDVFVLIEGKEWCQLGEECMAELTFVFPEAVPDILRVGKEFNLVEGPHVVARGTIVELLKQPHFWPDWVRRHYGK